MTYSIVYNVNMVININIIYIFFGNLIQLGILSTQKIISLLLLSGFYLQDFISTFNGDVKSTDDCIVCSVGGFVGDQSCPDGESFSR